MQSKNLYLQQATHYYHTHDIHSNKNKHIDITDTHTNTTCILNKYRSFFYSIVYPGYYSYSRYHIHVQMTRFTTVYHNISNDSNTEIRDIYVIWILYFMVRIDLILY